MIDVTKPLIGTLIGASSCDLYTSRPVYPDQEEGKVTDLVTWPLIDFANKPTGIGVVPSTVKGAMLRFDRPVSFNAVAISNPGHQFYLSNQTGDGVTFWKSRTSSYSNSWADSITEFTSSGTTYKQAAVTNLNMLTDVIAIWVPLRVIGDSLSSLDIGEIACMRLTDMPYTPVRDTYTITPNQNNVQTLTCQNGRKITYYASEPTYDIKMSYVWSDDGSKRQELHEIAKLRMTFGSPIVYYPAGAALNRECYYINAEQAPDIVNSDGTNYQMSIQGVTQP